MPMPYNRIAGQSAERLAALSDGVFAVAMTLLVLDLKAPALETIHDEGALLAALLGLAPRLLVYVMSFMTLGIFWVGQQTQLNQVVRTDRGFTWVQLGFLLLITLMPFSTALMAEFIGYRTALLVYWGNILLLGIALFVGWHCARDGELLRPDLSPEMFDGIRRRIVIAQSLYAVGALLCVISPYVSLGAIILVQLNYVFAPRVAGLDRI